MNLSARERIVEKTGRSLIFVLRNLLLDRDRNQIVAASFKDTKRIRLLVKIALLETFIFIFDIVHSTRVSGVHFMKKKTKLLFLALIAAGILIPTTVVLMNVNASPEILTIPEEDRVTAGPEVFEAGGALASWRDLAQVSPSYPYDQFVVNTNQGGHVFTFKLIPFNAVPFNAPASALVVVYSTTFQNTNYFFYGFKAQNGWWLMFFEWTHDQILIDSLLVLAKA
jgi:hypothetical protein